MILTEYDEELQDVYKRQVGEGYDCDYFGSGEDGAMKTNKTNITIDGDSFNFYFEKSGSNKGAGLTGENDDKYYFCLLYTSFPTGVILGSRSVAGTEAPFFSASTIMLRNLQMENTFPSFVQRS